MKKYWVDGTGNINDAKKWASSSGGTGGVGFDSNNDIAVIDVNSFSSAGTITFNVDFTCKGLIFDGVEQTVTLAGSKDIYISGDVTISDNIINTMTGKLYINGDSIITGNSLTFATVILKNKITFEGAVNITTLTLNPGTTIILDSTATYEFTNMNMVGSLTNPIKIMSDSNTVCSTIKSNATKNILYFGYVVNITTDGDCKFIATSSESRGTNDNWIFTDNLAETLQIIKADTVTLSQDNGKIIINGEEKIVYTHPETHNSSIITNDSEVTGETVSDALGTINTIATNATIYTPTITDNWGTTTPTTVTEALERMATLLKTLNSGNPIG
jgi:hypothetical protein